MNPSILARRSLALLTLALPAMIASPALADGTLWYNGDYDNRDATVDQNKVPINTGSGYYLSKSLVYDNFVVPVGQTWTISSVFANEQVAYYAAPTTATWEIRSGMSVGNGGTLVASGDTAATVTTLGTVSGDYYADTPEKISTTIASVVLTAGTYWLAVAPDSVGYYGDQAYIETTSGANAIGTPTGNDGNSFISSNFAGNTMNFASTTSVEGAGNWDYSMGVVGLASPAVSVPEPASLVMLALGLAGSSSAWLRRRGRPSVA